jgi:hypothetical protein
MLQERNILIGRGLQNFAGCGWNTVRAPDTEISRERAAFVARESRNAFISTHKRPRTS